MILKFLVLTLTAGMVGCATGARQTADLLKDPPPDLPRQKQILGVPFHNQTVGYCGPATLAMVFNHYGLSVTPEQLGPEVFTPGAKGSLQQDMIGASRRHGMMAVVVEGLPSLLREVADGRPVIIFENLGLNWYPSWHYAVVHGYDLNQREIVMHSGPTKNEQTSLKVFENSWRLADRWALVVMPPGSLSVTAGEAAHLTAASGLEQAGQKVAAEKAYLAILERWPSSLGALVGLGNVSFARGDRPAAIRYLKLAVKYHPDSAAAKHNLGVAKGQN